MELLLPMAVSFAITVIIMPFFIGYFNYRMIGQTTREESPTMGGTVFIMAILVTLLGSAALLRLLDGGVWMLLLTFLLFGGIGFIDDFISIFRHQNEGLTPRQKFLTQLIFSGIIVLIGLLNKVELAFNLGPILISNAVVIGIFAFIWITGFSNAVNLTDGLDGLATGLNIFAYGVYGAMALKSKQTSLALICLVVVGALIGFLYYNKKPAKIFMGDVGSLALGAGLAVISLLVNNPWSLLLVGIVFVVETASVMLQVASFKLTGKRIFKMSPIHHHFEMSGWSEQKVVTVFWLVGLLAGLGYYFIF